MIPAGPAPAPPSSPAPRFGRGLCLGPEGPVDADEGIPLIRGECGIPPDLRDHVHGVGAVLEDAGADVEALGGDGQRAGDLLEDLGGRPPQSPLDLAQVGIGDLGELGELAHREVGNTALLADEAAEVGILAVVSVLFVARLGIGVGETLAGDDRHSGLRGGQLRRLSTDASPVR